MTEDKKYTTTLSDSKLKIEKSNDKKIEIEKDKLTAILDANSDLRDRVDRLESAANKAGLARFDSQNKKALKRKVKLIQYDGMIVKSWSNMIKNTVEKNVKTKNWEEEQIIEVSFFEAEKPIQIHYETFNRNYIKIEAEIIKEQINMGEDEKKFGNRTYTVRTNDDKEYVLGKKFVN